MNLNLDPRARVGDLTIAKQQMMEVSPRSVRKY